MRLPMVTLLHRSGADCLTMILVLLIWKISEAAIIDQQMTDPENPETSNSNSLMTTVNESKEKRFTDALISQENKGHQIFVQNKIPQIPLDNHPHMDFTIPQERQGRVLFKEPFSLPILDDHLDGLITLDDIYDSIFEESLVYKGSPLDDPIIEQGSDERSNDNMELLLDGDTGEINIDQMKSGIDNDFDKQIPLPIITENHDNLITSDDLYSNKFVESLVNKTPDLDINKSEQALSEITTDLMSSVTDDDVDTQIPLPILDDHIENITYSNNLTDSNLEELLFYTSSPLENEPTEQTTPDISINQISSNIKSDIDEMTHLFKSATHVDNSTYLDKQPLDQQSYINQSNCDNHQCYNGGTCYLENGPKCLCLSFYSGDHCESIICDTTFEVSNAKVEKHGYDNIRITCDTGYALQDGRSEITITCDKWQTEQSYMAVLNYSLIDCSPVCDCQNNGYCSELNICICTSEFAGNKCQYPRCMEPPKKLYNAQVNYSVDSLSALIMCDQGYKLTNGEDSLEIDCIDGEWNFEAAYRSSAVLVCRPVCQIPCRNGGQCIKPDVCLCPTGFTGKECELRYENTVDGRKCIFPFIYANKWYYSCGQLFPEALYCAVQVDENNELIEHGKCSKDFDASEVTLSINGNICALKTPSIPLSPGCMCKTSKNTTEVVLLDMGFWQTRITESGEICDLPLYFEGKKYFDCIDPEFTEHWCGNKDTCIPDYNYGSGISSLNLTRLETLGEIVIAWPTFIDIKGRQSTESGMLCKTPCIQEPGKRPYCQLEVDGNSLAKVWDYCLMPNNTKISEETNSEEEITLLQDEIPIEFNEICEDNLNCTKLGGSCIAESFCTTSETDREACGIQGSDCMCCITKLTTPPLPDITSLAVTTPGAAVIPNITENITNTTIISTITPTSTVSTVSQEVPMPDPPSGGFPKRETTEPGVLCTFPFLFLDEWYTDCTQASNSEVPWCAIGVDMNRIVVKIGICKDINLDSDALESKTGVTTLDGQACIFPFIFNGEEHWECTGTNIKAKWCATEVNHLREPTKSSYCCNIDEAKKVILTESGYECHLPFYHQGMWNFDCIRTPNNPLPWCATQVAFNGDILTSDTCQVTSLETNAGLTEDQSLDDNGIDQLVQNSYPQAQNINQQTSNQNEQVKYEIIPPQNQHFFTLDTVADRDWLPLDGGNHVYNNDQQIITFHQADLTMAPTVYTTMNKQTVMQQSTSPLNHQYMFYEQPVHSVLYTVDGLPCVFPFMWDGAEHWGCYANHLSKLWCATSVDASRVPITSGYCKG